MFNCQDPQDGDHLLPTLQTAEGGELPSDWERHPRWSDGPQGKNLFRISIKIFRFVCGFVRIWEWFLQCFKVYDPRIRPAGENTTGLARQPLSSDSTLFWNYMFWELFKQTWHLKKQFFRWSISCICQCVRQKFLQDWRCQNGQYKKFVREVDPISFSFRSTAFR